MAISRADRIPVFGPVGFPVIALRFRRDVPAGILEANGAKQEARQCSSGGLVLDRLVVYRFLRHRRKPSSGGQRI